MSDAGQIAIVEERGEGASSFRWLRACAIGVTLAFMIFAAKAFWVNDFWLFKSDYVSFWAAGRLALAGHPSLAYDIAAHHAAEQAAGHVRGLVPFPYPPPFLAVVTPFAALPFGASYFAWLAATGGLYAWAARRFAPLLYAFALPPTYVNLLSGQTGLFFGGIFVGGISLIQTMPWVAGAMLGLMVLKPQLALLLPVAMLAGREWRVIAAAVLCASMLLAGALVLFGWNSYAAFFAILPHYVGFLRQSLWSWNVLISPFALARFVGLSQPVALTIHAAIAIVAALLTARAWWIKLDIRLPVLAAATLLVSPYVFTYDAVLMLVPMAWLIETGRHRAAALIWLLCLCPLLNYFTPLIWPNLTSAAAIFCLWMLHSDSARRRTPLLATSAEAAMTS